MDETLQQLESNPHLALNRALELRWLDVHHNTNRIAAKLAACQGMLEEVTGTCERTRKELTSVATEVSKVEHWKESLTACPFQIDSIGTMADQVEQLLESIHLETLKTEELQYRLLLQSALSQSIRSLVDGGSRKLSITSSVSSKEWSQAP
eukprot:NODE_5277_length_589_cov_36.535185_g4569_i0.p2 GENE.NODE_5277_length_589_cov_36.535185_g4569_i0~~NODE_5277_length_589_cov_36.535185_g4569_i0.p2  ORF type:complete len:151 (+),score=22.05 NODE_5277_length_589_cov_36.535185_g4569_i0:19-471(+)